MPAQLDPATREITKHCAYTANWFGYSGNIVENDHLNKVAVAEQTYDSIWLDGTYAISVEEGCNGINIMILFMAFVVAFGGKWLNMLLFIPSGVLFIYAANIIRLLLLSVANVKWSSEAYHFFHKYGFTAVIYGSVLVLWYFWVMHFSGRLLKKKKPNASS